MSINKIKYLELSIKKKLNSDFLGGYKSAFKGSGIVFSDLRTYVFGDSVKAIDWKTSAKYNDLYVKNYEEERDLKVLFLLDLTKTMDFGTKDKFKYDTLVELFLTLGLSTVANMDKLGVMIYNGKETGYFDFKTGEENIYRALSKLEHYVQNSVYKESINDDILKKLESIKIKDSLIFLLSDKLTMDSSIFKLFAVKNELVYINIFDNFENNLSSDNFLVSLKSKNKLISLILGDSKKLKRFQSLRRQKIEQFSLDLKNIGIDYLYIDDKKDIFKELLGFFKKRLSFIN